MPFTVIGKDKAIETALEYFGCQFPGQTVKGTHSRKESLFQIWFAFLLMRHQLLETYWYIVGEINCRTTLDKATGLWTWGCLLGFKLQLLSYY